MTAMKPSIGNAIAEADGSLNHATDTGMYLSDLQSDAAFTARAPHTHVPRAQLKAYRRLARVFAECPDVLLQAIVDIAVEFCGADSAGISLEESGENGERRFRWVAIAGSFSHFLGATTPRFFSPCGTTLDRGVPQAYRVTKAWYDFLGIEAPDITDGILIPWITDDARGTIWCISTRPEPVFDMEDFELLEGIADFAAVALRHQLQEQELRRKQDDLAYAAVANDLAHQINNPMQSVVNALFLAGHDRANADRYAAFASAEIDRINRLVQEIIGVYTHPAKSKGI